MTDYIREAVELADGWSMNRECIVPPDHSQVHATVPNQVLKDALAAQITRQVLAKGFDVHIDIQGSHFEAPGMWIEITDMNLSETKTFESDARFGDAENTIKAIIDSGVLSEQ